MRNWKWARSLFFLFAFVVLFSGFARVHTSASSSAIVPATQEELVIVIDSGDTLWGLANTYKKNTLDTREAIHQILKRNRLATSDLTIGQTVIIPATIVS
ncbi:LysM peptidoglycan-binding domain-containing protein [Cohnella abietis]|uniref:LysM domain-containing protein n=1 Tax=Cohnella abietis TaxID=2507935 RepID=A0A3T1D6F0_9BACL|nr:LysM peptidoglycan-binding domain-containing protein [Cohnella abietis]BBI33656.1 hypothetical protein KCTCHS21_30550 [Cohnella abietis]